MMPRHEACAIVMRAPKIPICDERLVGYELVSQDLSPDSLNDLVALAGMILDCDGTRGTSIPHLVAQKPDGTYTLWTIPQPR